MHTAVQSVVDGNGVVDAGTWRTFWDDLAAGRLAAGETVALLASLSARAPAGPTVAAFVESLRERVPAPADRLDGAVNLVGTGGGPPTFNVSTAAALVAATLGVPVAKSGSGGFTSRCGSLELLGLLGIPLARSHEAVADMLDRHGVAFAGGAVYPPELTDLARSLHPLDLRRLGRFVNSVGPFLAVLPVSVQVVGASGAAPLPQLRYLAERCRDRDVWLCTNALGIDELVSFVPNVILRNRRSGAVALAARGPVAGEPEPSLADLAPAPRVSAVAGHFLDILAGVGPEAALRTVCLNAAAAVVAAGHTDDWDEAEAAARSVLDRGAAVGLVERLRAGREHTVAVAP